MQITDNVLSTISGDPVSIGDIAITDNVLSTISGDPVRISGLDAETGVEATFDSFGYVDNQNNFRKEGFLVNKYNQNLYFGLNANNGDLENPDGRLFYSNDGGDTFSIEFLPGTSVGTEIIEAVSDTVLYFANNGNRAYRTTDGNTTSGTTLKDASSGVDLAFYEDGFNTSRHILAIKNISENRTVLVRNLNGLNNSDIEIMLNTDGGSEFTDVAVLSFSNFISWSSILQLENGDILVLIGDSGNDVITVRTSTDNGSTFSFTKTLNFFEVDQKYINGVYYAYTNNGDFYLNTALDSDIADWTNVSALLNLTNDEFTDNAGFEYIESFDLLLIPIVKLIGTNSYRIKIAYKRPLVGTTIDIIEVDPTFSADTPPNVQLVYDKFAKYMYIYMTRYLSNTIKTDLYKSSNQIKKATDLNNTTFINAGEPINDNDLTTKKYVDDAISQAIANLP